MDPNLTRPIIDSAIARAQGYLKREQNQDGGWQGWTIAGPDATAEIVIASRFVGTLSPNDAPKLVAYLLSQQLPDGSFPPYEGAHNGSLDLTSICYAALLSAGVEPSNSDVRRAYEFAKSNGGFGSTSAYTQILLAVAGVFPPAFLTPMPIFPLLIPFIERFLGKRFTPAYTLMSMLLPAIVCSLRAKVERPGWLRRVAMPFAYRKTIRYLSEHQNPTGNLFGSANMSVMMAIAFELLGVSHSDDRFARLLADLDRWRIEEAKTVRYMSFNSDVWNSALVLGTLRRGGVDGQDAALADSSRFLLREQSQIPLPRDWQNPRFLAPRTGGWAFEDRNPLCADCDSTSVALWGFGHVAPRSPEVTAAIDKALQWLWAMQNKDGGWPSFSHGQPTKPAGPFSIEAGKFDSSLLGALMLLLHVPPQLTDPSLEDVTGRVLQALGQLGLRATDERVARAVRFLHSQIDVNGAWWGRWETNYLAATAEVLAGLAAVEADLSHPLVQNAVEWVKRHQHTSGGFGETVESYSNLALAGFGEPSSYLTGIVTNALIACGEAQSETVSRAIRWCLNQQIEDGSWARGSYQFTMQWPWPFYQLTLSPVIYPLRAITAYRQALGG